MNRMLEYLLMRDSREQMKVMARKKKVLYLCSTEYKLFNKLFNKPVKQRKWGKTTRAEVTTRTKSQRGVSTWQGESEGSGEMTG